MIVHVNLALEQQYYNSPQLGSCNVIQLDLQNILTQLQNCSPSHWDFSLHSDLGGKNKLQNFCLK